jgi:predicted membrane-bound dolichyl-phosphate-mannose-protein mannosyltransferase
VEGRAVAALLLPPLGVFLAMRLALWVVASRAGFDAWDATNAWQRWDSGQYLSIADRGYYVVSCAGTEGYPEVGAPEWCGNGAWMPFYPALVAPFVALGFDPALVGATVAGMLHLATLVLLWGGFLGSKLTPGNMAVLIAAAAFPGQIYYHAIFPLSLFTFLVLLTVYLLLRDRWLVAAVTTGLAAATYPPGVFLAIVVAAWLVITKRRELSRRGVAIRALTTLGLGIIGAASVLGIQRIQVGIWDLFFKVQEKYQSDPHNPLYSFLVIVRRIGGDDDLRMFLGFQTLAVAAFVLAAVLGAERRVRSGSRLELLLVMYLVVFWLIPLAVGTEGLGFYRHQAMLLPGVILLRDLRPTIQWTFVGVFVLLVPALAEGFFTGALV